MKKVKFNCRTSVHMIPDNKMAEVKEKLEVLELEDSQKYVTHINVLTARFRFLDVNIGDVVEVPDWYYEAHKDEKVDVGVSIPNYTYKDGKICPFNAADAVKHGYIKNAEDLISRVYKFELIEESILTHKKQYEQNKKATSQA